MLRQLVRLSVICFVLLGFLLIWPTSKHAAANTCAPSPTNLALGRPAVASTVERVGLEAEKAVDGNLHTRWSSRQRVDPQWIYVDLGQISSIVQVVLRWEAAYGESYRIDFSNDAVNWTIASFQEAKNGSLEVIPVSGTARYVRMFGITRGPSGFGYSLFEFEVYDHQACEVPSPQIRPPDPVPGPQTLFFDDFEDGADPAWHFISGAWNVVNGTLETITPCAEGVVSSAVVGDTSWTDYEVQFDFRGVAGSVKHFQFRYIDETSLGRYWWQARNQENDIAIAGAGQGETLVPFPIQQGVWYRVRIRVEGEHIQVYVDDQLVIDRFDSGTERLNGGVGPFLRSGNVNCPFRVQYDNVIVNRLALPVLSFKQTNPEWAAHEYDHKYITVYPQGVTTCGTSIGQCGCALTSASMVLNYYGVNRDPDGNKTTPDTLNNYFKLPENNNTEIRDTSCTIKIENEEKFYRGWVSRGYMCEDVRWGTVSQYSHDANIPDENKQLVQFVGVIDYDPDRLREELNADNPVILKVKGPYGIHYVVATGIAGETFTINDPGFDKALLSDYGEGSAAAEAMVLYKKMNSDFSGLEVGITAPGQLLITSESGSQTGFDPYTSSVVEEIPNSSYFFNQLVADVTGQNPPPPSDAGVHWAYIGMPQAGNYEIEVFGSPDEPYSFVVYATDQDSNLSLNTAEGIFTPGGSQRYIFKYEPTPGVTTITLITLIDIKPGSEPDSVNPKSKGEIPVAILTTNVFDAADVDPTSVLFKEASPLKWSMEDVDGDGDLDMILHFKTQETGITCGDTSAILTGQTFGGQTIKGSDIINTVGCE